MKKDYTVFSKNHQPAAIEVTLTGGSKVMATVDSVKIQLVPDDIESGTITLSYTEPSEIVAADAAFTVGNKISVDFQAV